MCTHVLRSTYYVGKNIKHIPPYFLHVKFPFVSSYVCNRKKHPPPPNKKKKKVKIDKKETKEKAEFETT
jgi:hypothetical protein